MYFILKGNVLNTVTRRIFSVGSIIGETDIIYKRSRCETYVAMDNVYVLKMDRIIFEEVLKEFPEMKRDVEFLAREREKIRLHKIHQKEFMEQEDENKFKIMRILERIIKKDIEEELLL